MIGEAREDSIEYLWDMFGRHGTSEGRRVEFGDPRAAWADAVVAGSEIQTRPASSHNLSAPLLNKLLTSDLLWGK